MTKIPIPRPVIGWREWLSLPDLGIPWIKAKVDTGARSSAIHASRIEVFRRRKRDWVRFEVHPIQRSLEKTVVAEAPLLDLRHVKSSTGRAEERHVIETTVRLLDETWPIELTLAARDQMGFRMLLGRQAVRRRFYVDPGSSFYAPRPKRRKRPSHGTEHRPRHP